ncbi:MAG: lipoyl synthase [Deltaproteobacteria bacterium]|nr:lipoyl synthase [Deltaproteobacteria bacterium]
MVLTKKPDWIRVRGVDEGILQRMKGLVDKYNVHTVCEGATCPNMGECFCAGTATFMILGDICTRNCAFCSVTTGMPLPPDSQEPTNVALAAQELGLKHVVITCVSRDDLDDGGAGQFALTLKEIHRILPEATTDVLVSDLKGKKDCVATVLAQKPDIFAHNVETVPRLYTTSRQQADYHTSLRILSYSKEIDASVYTKSSLMLGLGETREEVLAVMVDLRRVGCDFITLGQYLRPATQNLEVKEFVTPEAFEEYRQAAEDMGFAYVASAPFVRSSFHSEDALKHIKK